MKPTHGSSPISRSVIVVIVAGSLIAIIGFGIRSIFGLFLEPMTEARGWDRETFALALAFQNLLWGIGVPIAGAIADRYGTRWVIAAGGIFYVVGVWGMAGAESGASLQLFAGVITGIGVACTSFALVLSAFAKIVGPEHRSWALGIGTAAGSLGQVIFSPLGNELIDRVGWQTTLVVFAVTLIVIIPLALFMPSDPSAVGEVDRGQSIRDALGEALNHRGYILLTVGFFVCGFHVAFIAVHFPAYVKDLGLPSSVGAYSLALVGAFNIVGSVLAGMAGQRWSKKYGLAVIYTGRSIAIVALLLLPKTELTIYAFAIVIGLLWLSTVPLTSGIVAQVFGARYMATLFGIVFFSHQLGSFLGVWLGGRVFDATGSYDIIWWVSVGLGIVATLMHLPIDEQPLGRLLARRVAT
jgi:MFS family permease